MTYVVVFIMSWAAFYIFGHKDRFRELYQSSLIAMVMSLSSDILISLHPLWVYKDPITTFPKPAIMFLDDFGLYPVMAYLYVQTMPTTWRHWILYTFAWTFGGICSEYTLIQQGYLHHQLGWSLASSYVADWIIFLILSVHHRWVVKTRNSSLILGKSGLAYIAYEEQFAPLTPNHPLQDITRTPGVQFYKVRTDGNVETFVLLMDPAAYVPVRSHPGHEVHRILEGSVIITVDGNEHRLRSGDIIHFSSSMPHSFTNPLSCPAKLVSFLLSHESHTLG